MTRHILLSAAAEHNQPCSRCGGSGYDPTGEGADCACQEPTGIVDQGVGHDVAVHLAEASSLHDLAGRMETQAATVGAHARFLREVVDESCEAELYECEAATFRVCASALRALLGRPPQGPAAVARQFFALREGVA